MKLQDYDEFLRMAQLAQAVQSALETVSHDDLSPSARFWLKRDKIELRTDYEHGFGRIYTTIHDPEGAGEAVQWLVSEHRRRVEEWEAGGRASGEFAAAIDNLIDALKGYPIVVDGVWRKDTFNGVEQQAICAGVKVALYDVPQSLRLQVIALAFVAGTSLLHYGWELTTQYSTMGKAQMFIDSLMPLLEQGTCRSCEGNWPCGCWGEGCSICEGHSACDACVGGKAWYWVEQTSLHGGE